MKGTRKTSCKTSSSRWWKRTGSPGRWSRPARGCFAWREIGSSIFFAKNARCNSKTQGIEDLLPSADAGPEEAYARSLLWEELEQALAELPEEQRAVFIAHEIDGRSFKEIAAETGVSVNTLLSQKTLRGPPSAGSIERYQRRDYGRNEMMSRRRARKLLCADADRDPGDRDIRIWRDESMELAGSGAVRRKADHLLAGAGDAGAEQDPGGRIFPAAGSPQMGAVDA